MNMSVAHAEVKKAMRGEIPPEPPLFDQVLQYWAENSSNATLSSVAFKRLDLKLRINPGNTGTSTTTLEGDLRKNDKG